MEVDEPGLKEGDPCPRCTTGKLRLRQTKRGAFLGCSNYPDCDFLEPVALHQQVISVRETGTYCPLCGGALAVKRGRYGLFIGCTNYPACSYVSSNSESDPVNCPLCKSGQLLPRISKSGQNFYSCNNYPECRFILPGTPVVRSCLRCGFPLMFEKKNARGVAVMCGNSLCPTRKKHRRKTLSPRRLTEAELNFLDRLQEFE